LPGVSGRVCPAAQDPAAKTRAATDKRRCWVVISLRLTETGLLLPFTLTENPVNDNTPKARGMEKVSIAGRSTVVSQYRQAGGWNPQQLIADNAGAYREFATLANGKTTRIRAVDGIHLSDEGAALLTPTLMNWLNPPTPTATAQLETASAQPKARSPRTVRR
jgi:hypothetical protein